MKNISVLIICLVAAYVLIVFTDESKAALNGYLTLEGSVQGEILGDVTQGGREDSILVYSFGHNIHLDRDPDTGLPTSSKVHTPLKIQKAFDRSSPQLYTALATGELIDVWQLDFYTISPQGAEVLYFQIRLTGARIVSITANKPTTYIPDVQNFRDMETISFTYDAIAWKEISSGNESSDSWTSR